MAVVTRDIRAFVSRDWQRVRQAKDAYWRDRLTTLGVAEALRIAEELRQQALTLNAAWPTEQDRRSDLLAHVRLARRLRRAATIRPR